MVPGTVFDNEDALERLDAAGNKELDAITYSSPPPVPSLSNPHRFVCSDGNKYWLKAACQNGLSAELIAGRIGHKIMAAPHAAIVKVESLLVQNIPAAQHLIGVVVGLLDIPDSINVKDIPTISPGKIFDPKVVDPSSRARVVAFHTWFGCSDIQVFIGLSNGRATVGDLGGCFGNLADQSDPAITIVPIPGIPDNHGSERDYVNAAVEAVESLTDDDLLRAAACIPNGGQWMGERSLRLARAKWLASRKPRLRKVMEQWK